MDSNMKMSFDNFSMLMKWNMTRSTWGRDVDVRSLSLRNPFRVEGKNHNLPRVVRPWANTP